MQALAAVAFIFMLIALGWNQPFEIHWRQVTGKPIAVSAKAGLPNSRPYGSSVYVPGAPVEPAAPVATPQDRSWLFRRTILDPPGSRR